MADIILNLYDEDITVSIQDPEEVTIEIQDSEVITINVEDNGQPGAPGDPGLNWLGDWDNLATYVANDGVYYQGSGFICTVGNNGQAPFEGSGFWDIHAKKGEGSTPKGAYNAGTSYIVSDIVEYNGSSYSCKSPTTGNAPPNATYWDLFVSKGDPGNPGTGIEWKGNWNVATAYVVNDAVFNNGSGFVCNTAHTGEEPPDPSYWDSFVNGLRFRGDWSGVINYNIGDLARSAGTVYICEVSHLNQAPPNLSYWAVFSEKGDTGATGPGVLEGSGAPSNGLGYDGESYIDKTNRIIYVGKASGDWANATQIPLAANPNGVRVTVGTNSQNPNASTPVAITFKGTQVYKDSGVSHSTSTNSARFAPETGKGGRYTFVTAINYDTPSAARINLHLYIRKNGTIDLDGDGDTFSGYSRNSGGSVTSTAFLMWSGELLDTDYIELMSEEGDVVGSVSIISTSFAEFKQETLLENQLAGSGFSPGTYQDLTLESLFSDSVENAQYRVSTGGRLYCKGMIRRTSGTGSVPFYFPSGARPTYDTYGGITDYNNAVTYRYRIKAVDGEFSILGITTGNNLDLNCIQFDT